MNELDQESSTQYRKLINTIAKQTKVHGYKRRGIKFIKKTEYAECIIQFQKKRNYSEVSALSFTVNIAIVILTLLEDWEIPLNNRDCWDGHLRTRLPTLALSSDRKTVTWDTSADDHWWEITGHTDIERLTNELWEDIEAKAIPFLQEYSSPERLLRFWHSGHGAGLTDVELKECRAELAEKLR